MSPRELERAAHELVEHYIRLAREAGRNWFEIGGALDLHCAAAASKESIADQAYDYALQYQPGTGRGTFSWMCPAFQQQVTENGPWPDPPEQEDGACHRLRSPLCWRDMSGTSPAGRSPTATCGGISNA